MRKMMMRVRRKITRMMITKMTRMMMRVKRKKRNLKINIRPRKLMVLQVKCIHQINPVLCVNVLLLFIVVHVS